MTPEQFKICWKETPWQTLFKFSEQGLSRFNLQPETVNFLSIAGLPDSAAPFLSFAQLEDGDYNSICRLREVYDFLEPELDRYIHIGSDGSGNPIVIDTSQNDGIK